MKLPIVTPSSPRLVLLIAIISSLFSGCADNQVKQYSKHKQTETLLENLSSSDKKLRVDTINALGKMRDPRSISALSKRLKSDNWVEREAVVNALAGINDYLVIEPLFAALSDDELFVKEAAQKALQDVVVRLGKKRDPRMIKQIVRELPDKQSHVRRTAAKLLRTAVRSLRFVDAQEYLKYILPGTTSKNRYVRLATVVILREIDDQSIYVPLVAALDDPAREVRNAAAESLMLLDKPDSIQPILNAMAHNNPFVRAHAAKLIRKYNKGSEEAEDIRALLKSDNANIRESAVIALQDKDDEKTISLIVPLLLDRSSLVRTVAVDYLDDKQWSPNSDELIAAQCVAKQAWLRCQSLGEAALKPLLTAAQDIDPEVRKSAGDSLVVLNWKPKTVAEQAQYCVMRNDWNKCQELGDAAVDSLINELTHVDVDVRVNVIKTLATIGSIRAVPALAQYIEAPDQEVRKAVVESFAYFNTKKVILPLIVALDDTAYDIRLAAVNSLQANIHVISKTKDVRIVQPIIQALQDNNSAVRRIAAKILGEIQNVQIVPPLMLALKDKDLAVRQAASEALHKIKNPNTTETFVQGLRSKNIEVRKQSVDILGGFNNVDLLPYFERMLEDPEVRVRISAVIAVGHLSDSRAVPVLEVALKDVDAKVRLQATELISSYENDAVYQALIRASDDKDKDVRASARSQLIKMNWVPQTQEEKTIFCIIRQRWNECLPIGIDALRPLLRELSYRDAKYKAEIVKVLGKMGNPQAVDAIIKVLEDSRYIKSKREREKTIKYSVRALQQIGKPSQAKLIPYLTNWYVGVHVVDVLSGLGWQTRSEIELIHYFVAKRDEKMLLSRWELTKKVLLEDVRNGNDEVRTNALYALIGLGVPDSIEEMIAVLNSKGSSIKIAEAYLNSGNKKLEAAAITWTTEQGHVLFDRRKGNQPVSWGKL